MLLTPITDYHDIRLEAREMTNEQACQILMDMLNARFPLLDDRQKEAVTIVRETMAAPLLGFLREEVPFRLREIFGIHGEDQDLDLVSSILAHLYENSDILFDYDREDTVIGQLLKELDR